VRILRYTACHKKSRGGHLVTAMQACRCRDDYNPLHTTDCMGCMQTLAFKTQHGLTRLLKCFVHTQIKGSREGQYAGAAAVKGPQGPCAGTVPAHALVQPCRQEGSGAHTVPTCQAICSRRAQHQEQKALCLLADSKHNRALLLLPHSGQLMHRTIARMQSVQTRHTKMTQNM
jgi:hypothetical protein